MVVEKSEVSEKILEVTGEIVSALIARGSIDVDHLPKIISDVLAALQGTTDAEEPKPETRLIPAVSIRRSITPDFIICLEDGKRFKSLKRHLVTLGLSEDEYRKKWNLPADYPMVAPNYSAKRSSMAKSFRLGHKAKTEAVAAKVEI